VRFGNLGELFLRLRKRNVERSLAATHPFEKELKRERRLPGAWGPLEQVEVIGGKPAAENGIQAFHGGGNTGAGHRPSPVANQICEVAERIPRAKRAESHWRRFPTSPSADHGVECPVAHFMPVGGSGASGPPVGSEDGGNGRVLTLWVTGADDPRMRVHGPRCAYASGASSSDPSAGDNGSSSSTSVATAGDGSARTVCVSKCRDCKSRAGVRGTRAHFGIAYGEVRAWMRRARCARCP
jgi:hypothetical protein